MAVPSSGSGSWAQGVSIQLLPVRADLFWAMLAVVKGKKVTGDWPTGWGQLLCACPCQQSLLKAFSGQRGSEVSSGLGHRAAGWLPDRERGNQCPFPLGPGVLAPCWLCVALRTSVFAGGIIMFCSCRVRKVRRGSWASREPRASLVRSTSTYGSKATKETPASQASPACQAERAPPEETANRVCPAPEAPR